MRDELLRGTALTQVETAPLDLGPMEHALSVDWGVATPDEILQDIRDVMDVGARLERDRLALEGRQRVLNCLLRRV